MAEFSMNLEVKVQLDPRWRQVEDLYIKAVEIAARNVETKAKNTVPYKTGATKNSIMARPAEAAGMGFGKTTAWRVGPTTAYAPFLEFGTVYMDARPYLIPAVESESPRLKEAIKQINDRLK